MRRTHRELLVLNYWVSFNDSDDTRVVEWRHLKKYLTRREIIQLIKEVKNKNEYNALYGKHLDDNPIGVRQVVWS